ncbi:MAG TPA: glycosyl transferase family 1, partial [Bacteroidales bacterium]|nr:glycosyl transferase family 1 [Bacteroidales bacterium]
MKNLTNKKNILIYQLSPFNFSETFVYNQTIRLKRYRAYFLGNTPRTGYKILLPNDRTKFINNGGIRGKFREYLFDLLEYIPSDVVDWARKIQPKLLHVHSGYDATLIMSLAKTLGIPLMVSFLGTDATIKDEFYSEVLGIKGYLHLIRRQRLSKLVSMIVVPSEFLKVKVIEKGFPKNKIKVIHHGVDLEKFQETNKNIKFGHILFVGRLIKVKGLDLLIHSIKLIKEQYPEVYLTVIGEGPLRKEYELLASEELKDNFQFLGYQPPEIIRDYLQTAYLFSMPSIILPNGQAESFGLVFVEAQAMGVPVVSFATGGIPEVVANGETGLLSEDCIVESLAEN